MAERQHILFVPSKQKLSVQVLQTWCVNLRQMLKLEGKTLWIS